MLADRRICADTAHEAGVECTGPSLALVPLRGTKDCTQDDNPRFLETVRDTEGELMACLKIYTRRDVACGLS